MNGRVGANCLVVGPGRAASPTMWCGSQVPALNVRVGLGTSRNIWARAAWARAGAAGAAVRPCYALWRALGTSALRLVFSLPRGSLRRARRAARGAGAARSLSLRQTTR